MAGCSIVVKPSPLASITTLLLGEAANSCGLPRGSLNIITGGTKSSLCMSPLLPELIILKGPPSGDPGAAIHLTNSDKLDKLSFTGSTSAGVHMLKSSAELIRPTSLELGGKGAMVVFEDVDIDVAVVLTSPRFFSVMPFFFFFFVGLGYGRYFYVCRSNMLSHKSLAGNLQFEYFCSLFYKKKFRCMRKYEISS